MPKLSQSLFIMGAISLLLSSCATRNIKATKANATSVIQATQTKSDALATGPDTNLVQFSQTPFLGNSKKPVANA